MGNVLSIENQARNVRQNFQYDDLYQLVTAKGFADDGNKRNEYHQTFTYDTIGNITKKTSYNHLTPGNEKPNVLNYTFNYLYNGTKPHAPNQIGNWVYTYDANGNIIKKVRLAGSTGNSSQNDRKNNGNDKDKDKEDKSHGKRDGLAYGREDLNDKNKAKKDPPGQGGRSDSDIEGGGISGEYFWNEENRLVEARNDGNGKSTYFLYDYKGDRTIKRGQGGETLYVNEYYQLQNQNIITKHIFVGNTRIVSKLTHYSNYDPYYEKKNIYTYHPDHLGSSNFVTDPEGNEFEHMEYTPYGESWVDEGTNKNVIGYRFTSKELDTETRLYYFGARYLDPLTSRWISPDPAFEKYLPERPVDDEARERNSRLPSQGGIFYPNNLSLYGYGSNNPVKYVDPDGEMPFLVITGAAGALIGAGIEAYRSYQDEGEINWGRVGKGTLIGGAIGLGTGTATAYVATGSALASTGTVVTSVGSGLAVAGGLGAKAIEKALSSVQRIQHASRHLIDAGILPNWSKNTLEMAKQLYTQVLSNPSKTFNYVLKSGEAVKGFYSKVNGQDVVVFVYKSGQYVGQIATSIVPSAQQMQSWGL